MLYAPGLTELADIRQVVASVDRPVNVLAMQRLPACRRARRRRGQPDLGRRVASRMAYGALADAAAELRDRGTYSYLAAGPRPRPPCATCSLPVDRAGSARPGHDPAASASLTVVSSRYFSIAWPSTSGLTSPRLASWLSTAKVIDSASTWKNRRAAARVSENP